MKTAAEPTSLCMYCGEPIPEGGRPSRKYCKPSHRTLAFRARSAQQTKPPPSLSAANRSTERPSHTPAVLETALATTVLLRNSFSIEGNPTAKKVGWLLQLNVPMVSAEKTPMGKPDVGEDHRRLAEHHDEPLQLRTQTHTDLAEALKREQQTQVHLEAAQRRLAEREAELEQLRIQTNTQLAEALKREQEAQAHLEAANRCLAEREAELLQLSAKAPAELAQQAMPGGQDSPAELQEQLSGRESDLQCQIAEAKAQVQERQQENETLVQSLAQAQLRLSERDAVLADLREHEHLVKQALAESQKLLAETTSQKVALQASVEQLHKDYSAAVDKWTELWTEAGQRISALQKRLWLLVGLPQKLPPANARPGHLGQPPTEFSFCNPLVPFVEYVLTRLVQVGPLTHPSVHDVIKRHSQHAILVGLLMAQAQLAALLVPSWANDVRKRPESLVRCVEAVVKARPDLYPPEIPEWTEQNEAVLSLIADQIKLEMRTQIRVQMYRIF